MEKTASSKQRFVAVESVPTENGFGLIVNLPDDKTLIYNDISPRREVTEKMAELINRNQVSELHIRDIIEDMLG